MTAVLAGLLTISLNACSATPEPTVQVESPSPTVSASPTPSDEPTDTTTYGKLGEPYTWDDGIEAIIGTPDVHKATAWAPNSPWFKRGYVILVKVRVTNGSSKAMELDRFVVGVGDGVNEGEPFEAKDHKVVDPTGMLKPGKSITWTAGFKMGTAPDESALHVVAQPDFSHGSVRFVS